MYRSGIFTGNANASDDQLFICEQKTFSRLCANHISASHTLFR